MADISTTFLGLPIRSPLIVGASSLCSTISGICKAEEQGAGAIVLKSLFEEQMRAQIKAHEDTLDTYAHPEARDYLENMGLTTGAMEYLNFMEEAAGNCSIPLIASLNCISPGVWLDFTRKLEAAGAKGIELNIGLLPVNPAESSQSIEDRVVSVVRSVRELTSLPIGVKLGNSWTNLPALSARVAALKIQSLVLFNRFYQLDINIDTLQPKSGTALSSSHDFYATLRWISLLYKKTPAKLVASGGVHDSGSVIKLILAGAESVQVCSALYKNGYGILKTMTEGLVHWMESKKFSNLEAFRGTLSQDQSTNPELHERIQYIQALTGMY